MLLQKSGNQCAIHESLPAAHPVLRQLCGGKVNFDIWLRCDCFGIRCSGQWFNLDGSQTFASKIWIVMEYLEGGSLAELIKDSGPLDEPTIAYVLKELLSVRLCGFAAA